MKGQVKWGLAFVVLGLAILPFGYPLLLVYSIPLVAIGAGLIWFRNREDVIEEVD
jgi:hypothetical protein